MRFLSTRFSSVRSRSSTLRSPLPVHLELLGLILTRHSLLKDDGVLLTHFNGLWGLVVGLALLDIVAIAEVEV